MTMNPKDYDERVLDLLWADWTIELHRYEDGTFYAGVVELPGCMTEAGSAPEAVDALEEARAEWLSAAIEQGLAIPRPMGVRDYSGKVFVRVSPSLHKRVALAAARQGVSMSQWVAEVLAGELEPEAHEVG